VRRTFTSSFHGRGSGCDVGLCLAVCAALLAAFACSAPTPRTPPSTRSPANEAVPATAESIAISPVASPAQLARYERAAAYSAKHSGRVLLIARGSSVVYAAGQNGHPVDEPHPLYSASESFWGLLGVAADADGLLDLDEPVSRTIPEFGADPLKREVRLRQLLNFTSGLERGVQDLRRDEVSNLYERSLQLDMVSEAGARFRYGSGQLYVFAAVLSRKLEGRYDDPLAYLEERILEPIGLEVAGWERDGDGNPDVAYGARLAASEWAKWGMLLRDRGSFTGSEVIPADAVDAVFRGSADAPDYGLTLWLNRSETAGKRFYGGGLPGLAFAAGVGNQRLYVIPSLDLVVVRFGDGNRHWSDDAFLSLLVTDPPTTAAAPQ